jgi:hypothetical protein
MSGKGAVTEVLWVGTGLAGFAVVAARERLEAHELRAGGALLKGSVDITPAHASVLFEVTPGSAASRLPVLDDPLSAASQSIPALAGCR